MRIQHNITAMNAYRNFNNNTSAIGKNLEKLSSGYKINRAGDDAAGLAVSQKMRLQISGLDQAQKNAKSGISYVQTAEGALQEVHEMLERMYTLAEQSANGTFDDDTDRTQLQKEVNNLMEEINRIGKTANFNGMGIFAEYVGGSGKFDEGEAVANQTASASLATTGGTAPTDWGKTDDDVSALEGSMTVTIDGTAFTVTIVKSGGTAPTEEDTKNGTKVQAKASGGSAGLLADIKAALDKQIKKHNDDGAKGDANYTKISNFTLKVKTGDADALDSTYTKTPMTLKQEDDDASGATPGTIDFWIGAEPGDDNKLTINTMNLSVSNIQVADGEFNNVGQNLTGKVDKGNISGVDITNADAAMTALSTIKTASNSVSNMRGTLGAMQNRLDHTIKNLSVMQENMQDAESVIRDTDVAEEMMAYTKNNILIQSAQAMLAQANQIPQGVLQLLQ